MFYFGFASAVDSGRALTALSLFMSKEHVMTPPRTLLQTPKFGKSKRVEDILAFCILFFNLVIYFILCDTLELGFIIYCFGLYGLNL